MSSKLLFRKAKRAEADAVRALYRSVTGSEYCTWNSEYPGDIEIETDLAAGTLYVLEKDGVMAGAISIVPENEMDDLDCWRVRGKAREFARVTVCPEYQGKGLSKYLVKGVLTILKKQGINAVHISVAKKNIPAQKLYRGMGFVFCGEAEMYDNYYYLCEKTI